MFQEFFNAMYIITIWNSNNKMKWAWITLGQAKSFNYFFEYLKTYAQTYLGSGTKLLSSWWKNNLKLNCFVLIYSNISILQFREYIYFTRKDKYN